jgi:aminoglycoside 3-N-acetyltransferase
MFVIPDTYPLLTTRTLIADFERIGLRAGQTVLMHSSMKAVGGFVVGGAQAVVDAVLHVLTADGTLVMPTFSGDNTDPGIWKYPAVPESWWETIRAEWPPYRPGLARTRQMGIIADYFRTYPGVLRSSHPACSFAAWGKNANGIIADHPLDNYFGANSPLDHVYELDGYVLLLGVGHWNNTSLHRAEYLAEWPGKGQSQTNSSAAIHAGQRVRVTYQDGWISRDDFPTLGAEYEAETTAVIIDAIGKASVRFMRQRPLIDYAARWMSAHRPASLQVAAPPQQKDNP